MRRWRLISLPRRNASAAPCPGQCLNSAAKPTAFYCIALYSIVGFPSRFSNQLHVTPPGYFITHSPIKTPKSPLKMAKNAENGLNAENAKKRQQM